MQAFRKILFWMHLACGVGAGIVVFIMSITGVALTYEKQMLRWADGFHAEPPSPGAPKMGPEALLTKARLESGKEPSGVTYDAGVNGAARLLYGRDAVVVNPYTGEELGAGATGLKGFFGQMILWHRWLGQEGEGRATGKAITGACNMAFLFIVISGMYLWWPKKWSWQHLRPIVWFRGGLAPKAREFNWHNTMGFWCAIPLVFVVATATFFSYPWTTSTLYELTGEPQAQPPAGGGYGGQGEARKEEPQPPSFDGLDAAWASAQQAVPDWRTLSFRPAGKPGEPLSVAVDRGSGGQPQLRSTLTIDAATGEVLKHETIADMTTGRRIRSYIRFIHTGEVFGLAGQTIAGVASLAACFLVYTGWMLTWRRFRGWQARR